MIAPVGFLLALALFAALPAAAFAAPEMRGEWELVLKTSANTLKGKTVISNEPNGSGEFAGQTVHYEFGLQGSFSGTLEAGNKASVLITTEAAGPLPASKFTSSAITVVANGGSVSMSGEGTFVSAETLPATLTATRIKTYQQVEEQEVLEAEQADKEGVRGEWSLTTEFSGQTVKGTAVVTGEPTAKNEFASSSALFESTVAGAFSGTLKGSEASVTVTTQATGPVLPSTFTGTKLAIALTNHSMSISGPGIFAVGGNELPATLTATRIKTYQQIAEQEKREREATEKQEKEAKEKLEREASEKLAREAHERQAREAAEKAVVAKTLVTSPPPAIPALVTVTPVGKSFTLSSSALLSLPFANPNPYAVAGRVTLLVSQSVGSGKSSGSKHTTSKKLVSLGTASFGISTSGKEVVKVKLSQRGRTEMAHHSTLRVLATITTQASGQTTVSKTFSLTLHSAKAARSKH